MFLLANVELIAAVAGGIFARLEGAVFVAAVTAIYAGSVPLRLHPRAALRRERLEVLTGDEQ